MTKKPVINKTSLRASLNKLQKQLIQLKPTGPDGFEGLVATALADFTGLTFRLAKSGSQFGRDASTPRARFAIAMEAKRYSKSLRLEDVAGKIWIASHELASDVDLWALCATSEMGDGVLAKLEQMLEERGISLLMLDWTAAPLPRLAVLLAASREKVVQWWGINTTSSVIPSINEALVAVGDDDAFVSAKDQLRKDTSAGYSGLAALAKANLIWCDQVFSELTASKRAFGQHLTVCDPNRPVIARPSIEPMLAAALSTAQKAPGCVAILGPEGTGKSWLAVRWWAKATDKPILVIGCSQVADLINPKEPLETLAKLIAMQGEGNLDEHSERWLRRLRRWHEHPSPAADQLKFLVVIDGLNEKSEMPWADTIFRLSEVVYKLGGQLLLTCRERFWEREIAPRLAGVKVASVRVRDYTPEELNELLQQHNINIENILKGVRTFIRNPRICAVALDLLDRLSAQADELTIERLLLEYWRRRLEERGDLVAHNIRDFEKLLRSHARALLEDPGVQFDRDEWREHSGAARRGDGRSVENDLTDIEEGAFLRVVEDREGFYEFKPDTVPFALGLLLARELQDELRKQDRNPAEVIDSIVEEVQGFDLVGDVLQAATGIACFETRYPPNGRAALILAWIELQNIPDSGYEALAAYATACPEGALDAIETAFDERVNIRRREWLIEALLNKRDRPNVDSDLKPRIARWLGLWSRMPRQLGTRDAKEEARLSEQTERIADRHKHLTPVERDFLAKACREVDAPEAMQLDTLAALLLAGCPQSAHAEGILAWAFASALTGDFLRADADLRWVVRLNTVDFPIFEQKLHDHIAALLGAPHSDVSREAAATALRVLGTVAASAEADSLYPRQRRKGWRRVENYCATDPFDPDSARPENLANAINAARTITPEKLWSSYSAGKKEYELEWITPGLARFEPDAIVHLLRSVACTTEIRSNLSLRQISWNLQRISPLFDEITLSRVLSGYKRLVQRPDLIDDGDRRNVAGSILLSLLPHFRALEQLQLFLELPDEVPDLYDFRNIFMPFETADLEKALSAANSDPVRLRRTLFFVSAHLHTLNDQIRAMLGHALDHDDPLVVTCASDVAYIAQDTQLDMLVIAAARRRGDRFEADRRTFWRDRAVAAAVASLKHDEDISLISPRFLGFVAAQFGGKPDSMVTAGIDLTIKRLLKPIKAPEPQLGQVFLNIGKTGQEYSYRVKDRADDTLDEMFDRLQILSKKPTEPRQSIDEFTERQKALWEEAEAYFTRLEVEGAQALIREPDITSLKRVVAHDLEKAILWTNRILKETNSERLSTIRNFALGLAEALADTKPESAAALLIHVADVWSPIRITVGDARIPQEIAVLFSGPDVPILSKLRGKALLNAATDADLETLVFAAEAAGQASWLQGWIDREISTENPGCIARALTIEGLRNAEIGSSSPLRRNWGSGFLGNVAKHAFFTHNRNAWSKHWLTKAVDTSDPVEFWRWGELTAGIADIRAFHWFPVDLDTAIMRRFGIELFKRIRNTAEKRTKKRKDTLFGLKKPNQKLTQLLSPISVR